MSHITAPSTKSHDSGCVNLKLPYPVSLNRIWRSARTKKKDGSLSRPFVYPSKEYKAWVAEAHVAYLQQRRQLAVKSVKGWYSITIIANPPDERRRDLGNLEKVTSDFLKTVGVIEDDSLAQHIDLRWGRQIEPNTMAVFLYAVSQEV